MTADEHKSLNQRVHDTVMGGVCSLPADALYRGSVSLTVYAPAPRYSEDMRYAWVVHQAMCERIFSVRRRYLAAIQAQADAMLSPSNREAGATVVGLDVLAILRDRFAEAICLAAVETVGTSRPVLIPQPVTPPISDYEIKEGQ